MITVLSPAKKLSTDCFSEGNRFSKPVFLEQSSNLVSILKSYDPPDLQSLMGISENLSELNWERFQSWTTNTSPDDSRQAVYSFKGDTYTGLDADTLKDSDLDFAQNNIRILTGLYGLLKPLDLMLPYRLEMGTKLENKHGKNLYEFWGESLSKTLSKELENHKNKIIINCASNEYFKSIDNSSLDADVIDPQFKEIKNGKTRIISFFAKKARGMMARYIIDNKIVNSEDIYNFDLAGYKYDESLSSIQKPVFTRAQP